MEKPPKVAMDEIVSEISRLRQEIEDGLSIETKPVIATKINLYKDYTERDEKWAEVAHQLYEIGKIKDYYSDEHAKLLKNLKSLSGDTSSHGGEYYFKKEERTGSVDYKAIPAVATMSDEDLDVFRRRGTAAWKINKK